MHTSMLASAPRFASAAALSTACLVRSILWGAHQAGACTALLMLSKLHLKLHFPFDAACLEGVHCAHKSSLALTCSSHLFHVLQWLVNNRCTAIGSEMYTGLAIVYP